MSIVYYLYRIELYIDWLKHVNDMHFHKFYFSLIRHFKSKLNIIYVTSISQSGHNKAKTDTDALLWMWNLNVCKKYFTHKYTMI